MKLTVTKDFIDKNTSVYHKIGEVVEYPEARAKEIEYRGFGRCEASKPSKAEPKAEKKEKAKEEEMPKKVSKKK